MKLNNRFRPLSWVLTRVEPFSLSPAIQHSFQETADLPVAHIRTMDHIVIQSTARDEFNTMVLGTFAFVAILLASIGLYGLMAYSVEQRTLSLESAWRSGSISLAAKYDRPPGYATAQSVSPSASPRLLASHAS